MKRHAASGTGAALEARGLVKSFGARAVVDGVDFALAPGTVTGLLGPNGAGKTTLVQLALGLLRPDAGALSVFGQPPGSAEARQRTGAMLQDAELPPLLRVCELVTLFRKGYAAPMDERALIAAAGLDDIYGKRYGRLSGGEKRRVQCALALSGDPALLLLDEPTVHMDAGSRELFWNAVVAMRGRGCCVLVVSHQRDEVQALADHVLLMREGRVQRHAASGPDHAAGWSRVSFAGVPGLRPDQLTALGYVREVRQVGRLFEVTACDVAALLALLGQQGVNLAGVAVAPALEAFEVPIDERKAG